MKFFDRAEIKDMLAYLCVINNPADDLRLRRIVNVPSRKIGQATVDKAQTIATEQETTLYQVFRQAADYPELKNVAGKLIAFTELIESIRRQVEGCDLIELYDMVCDKSGYTAALREKNDMESRGRWSSLTSTWWAWKTAFFREIAPWAMRRRWRRSGVCATWP